MWMGWSWSAFVDTVFTDHLDQVLAPPAEQGAAWARTARPARTLGEFAPSAAEHRNPQTWSLGYPKPCGRRVIATMNQRDFGSKRCPVEVAFHSIAWPSNGYLSRPPAKV